MKLRLLKEAEIIHFVRKEFFSKEKGLALGIGDDAAVIRAGTKSLILTKDLLIENVHFKKSFHPPRMLGRKSLAVNVSDIAAMGAKSRFALLGLGLPKNTPPGFVESFFEGFKAAAENFSTVLIGGDVCRAEKVTISVTVIGEGRKIVTRSGARPGHIIYVSGHLGNAAEGLAILKKGVRWGEDRERDVLLKAFLDPDPCLKLGAALAKGPLVSSMIDLSDGLSADLDHICRESGCGAEIEKECIPLSSCLKKFSRRPYDRALYGGEDYQLLFTVPPEKVPAVEKIGRGYCLTRIGRIIRRRDIFIIENKKRRPLIKRSFEHF
ncbi:MAG: thiamine-phosphate kinase [Candidatus Aminicenantes bacterium]|nr:thiamine-phosphate kinase [Candidatus Aminicenantes bacterium]